MVWQQLTISYCSTEVEINLFYFYILLTHTLKYIFLREALQNCNSPKWGVWGNLVFDLRTIDYVLIFQKDIHQL